MRRLQEQEAEAAAEAAMSQPDAAAGEAEEAPQAKIGPSNLLSHPFLSFPRLHAHHAWHACRSFLTCVFVAGPGLWGSLRGVLAQAVGFIKGAKTQAQQRQQVRDTFAKHQAALTDLSSRLAALDRKLGLDFGPSGVFAELLDRCALRPPQPDLHAASVWSCMRMLRCRCFSADVDKYTYEVCMYGEARQREGGASTSLGSWRGFEDGHSTLLFDGGQQCWNGPQRSMRARPLPLHMACKFWVSWWGCSR